MASVLSTYGVHQREITEHFYPMTNGRCLVSIKFIVSAIIRQRRLVADRRDTPTRPQLVADRGETVPVDAGLASPISCDKWGQMQPSSTR